MTGKETMKEIERLKSRHPRKGMTAEEALKEIRRLLDKESDDPRHGPLDFCDFIREVDGVLLSYEKGVR